MLLPRLGVSTLGEPAGVRTAPGLNQCTPVTCDPAAIDFPPNTGTVCRYTIV